MPDITHILNAFTQGDPGASDELLALLHAELRQLASQQLQHERTSHTLNPTALVHEAYLRLVGEQTFANRAHFFAAAAEAMRRVLINYARDRQRLKRGRGRLRVELIDYPDRVTDDPDLVMTVDEVLQRLEVEDSIAARVARLHLLGGLSIEEAGETLGLARATAYRNWKYARAWLREALTPSVSDT